MNITYFKKVKDKNPVPFYRDIDFALNRIKNGASIKKIEECRTSSPDLYKKLKEDLPVIKFAGTFSDLSDDSLIKSSGLIIFDFDKFKTKEDLINTGNKLREDEYTFALFISPSGNGYKVIVQIPIATKQTYKLYFEAIEDYYLQQGILNFDPNNSNISRACFESYDPNIYINKKSKQWDKITEEKQLDYRTTPPLIKLDNESEIVKRLYSWHQKKFPIISGNRNENIFILASAFSDYGVSEFESLSFCTQFIQEDFTKTEIDRTIKSAYKKCKSNFGMKYFEDNKSVEQVKKLSKEGKSVEEIKEQFTKVDEETIKKIADNAKINDFWYFDNGKVKIDNYHYKRWLENKGFYKLYPEDGESFVFVKMENNLIDNTTEFKIKDYILNFLIENEEKMVYQYMTSQPKLFKDDWLNILDPATINFQKDTKETAYIYFKNGAVKVTENNIELIDYIDLEGFVWKKHIIDFDFKKSVGACDFSNFINNIASKDQEKYYAITSTIGYLLHSYKSPAKNVAVIFNDELISENPNGGTGKGIVVSALSKMKRVTIIEGKTFTFDKSFPYQTVGADTQLLVFDDVKKNFNFESLFSLITEGITLEKKNRDAIKLPVDKSPKVLITTNYTVGGEGNSFERRKWDIEFSQHYNKKHKPSDDFGHELFDDWDNSEWLLFYNFMLSCVQMYLENGLVEVEFKNIKLRTFIKNTSFNFNDWANDKTLEPNVKLIKSNLFNEYINEYTEDKKWVSKKRFSGWLEKYATFKEYKHIEGRDKDARWIHLINK